MSQTSNDRSSASRSGAGFLIADETRVLAELDGLARRIHATLGPDLHIVGILRRGAPLAREVGRRLADLREESVDVGTLRLKRYADDLTILHDEPELDETEPSFEVEGTEVLLVDDVIYSGRTFLKAVTHLDAAGASMIHLAALCSRGEDEVPVYAKFVAMQVDVGEGTVVEVHAPPFEDEWGVWLFHQEDLTEG